VALLGAGLFLISTTPRPELVVAAESSPADDWLAAAASPTAPMVVLVDVAGGVARPGVYELPAGSRVADAVRAAGGFGPLADAAAVTATINLAEAVSDGLKIHIPQRGEVPPLTGGLSPAVGDGGTPDGTGPSTGGLIDVNTATEAQLDTLPGVGPVTVGKILAARAEAPFATVDELLERGVLGPSTFEKVRPLVTVGS
jgi:competence protein ComEA